MGLIIYDEKTLLDAKNRIDTCNDQILDALTKIYNEFENMNETLSTPKSNNAMPLFVDYLNKQVNFVRSSKENYNRMMDTINGEYHDYDNSVNRMVGGHSEK